MAATDQTTWNTQVGVEMDRLQNENQKVKQDKESVVSENQELKQKLKSVVGEKQELTQKVEDLEGVVEKLQNEKESLFGEKQTLKQENEKLRRRHEKEIQEILESIEVQSPDAPGFLLSPANVYQKEPSHTRPEVGNPQTEARPTTRQLKNTRDEAASTAETRARKRRATGRPQSPITLSSDSAEDHETPLNTANPIFADQNKYTHQGGPADAMPKSVSVRGLTLPFDFSALGPEGQPIQIRRLPDDLLRVLHDNADSWTTMFASFGAHWRKAASTSDKACLWSRIAKLGNSDWSVDNPRRSACKACANKQRPCFIVEQDEILLLPLPKKPRGDAGPSDKECYIFHQPSFSRSFPGVWIKS